MALRAITRDEIRISHPSEDDLPEKERTWFRYRPATAKQWGRIRDAGMVLESFETEGGETSYRQVFKPGQASTEYLRQCLTGIDNLVDHEGAALALPTEKIDGEDHFTYEALDAIPASVQVWLSREIQKSSENTEEELGESSSQPT